MDKIAVKKRIIIMAVLLVLMLVAYFMLAWKPQIEQLADLDQQWTQEGTKMDAAKTTLIMLGDKRKQAAKVEAELVSIRHQMPTDAELPDLIVSLQNMANDAGVDLMSLKPTEPASRGDFSEIQITLAAEGSYVPIIDFLKRIEKAERAFKVNTVDVKYKQDSYPDLSLNVMISAFTVNSSGESSATPVQSAASKAATSTAGQ